MKFIGLFLFLGLLACNTNQATKNQNYYELGGYTQGTSYHITFGADEFINLKPEIDSILDKINNSLSVYDSTSIISRINRNDTPVIPDQYFIDVITKSIEIMELSNGAFDITVAPLIDFWGFGPNGPVKKDKRQIENILKHIGSSKINLAQGKFTKSSDDVKINVNAIAQGYTVDVVSNLFTKKGIRNFLVEIGGEVRTMGINKDGKIWKVGIDKPADRIPNQQNEIQAIVSLKDMSISTSGNYKKFYIENGFKYSHTINPKTGYPAKNEMLSATIIAKDCATADALATACMVLGLEEGKKFISRLPDVECFFIYSRGTAQDEIYFSPGFEKYFDKTNADESKY